MSIHLANVHDLLDGSVQVRGTGVLVDRIWPRGVKKERLGHDEWLRDAAPSTDLRKWFGHDPDRFEEFASRYRHELEEGNEDVDRLRTLADAGEVTLLYSAHDHDHNQAVVLKAWLEGQA